MHIPFIATMGSGMWVENTVGAIMDNKGIAYIYLQVVIFYQLEYYYRTTLA
jgi:hypothetical protein